MSPSFLRRSPAWAFSSRNNDVKTLEHLAKIVVNHNLDAERFFHAIVDARVQGEADCETMRISCRMRTEDLSVFLFEEGDVVVGQIHISRNILKGNSARLEAYSSGLRRENESWIRR